MTESAAERAAIAQPGGTTRFETAFAAAPIGMSVVSAAGRCLEANDALCRLLGYSAEDLAGVDLFDLTHPDDRRAARDTWRRLVEGSAPSPRTELRYLRRDGTPVWVAITSTMLRDAAGSPLYAVSQTEDIGPRKEAEAARLQMERRYSDLFERSNDMIFTLDLAGVFTAVNPAAEAITGFAPADLSGRRLIDLVVEGDADRAGRMLDRLLEGHDGTWELELQTADGGTVFVEAACRLATDGDRPTGIEGIARETTERRLLQQELERRSFYDSLTGFPNRALFLDRLGQAVARLQQPGEWVAVLLLGLDGFKALNGRLGHAGGDELLRKLAPMLEEKLRGSDTVARLGGDQFGLIVENLQSEEHLPIVARRILSTVSTLETPSGPLSASLGIALAEPSSSPDALLENAHTAMHRAKRTNRGGFELYTAELRELRSVGR